MRVHKDLRPVYRLARERGWVVTVAGDGHIKWTSPHGQIVTTVNSPPHGRSRSLNNALARLRKAGLR
jgi:hypothetical protein